VITSAQWAADVISAVDQRRPDVVRLATIASAAVRVEPHLIRRLRLDLLPDADVGVEADLWFSPLVESRGADAIVFSAPVAKALWALLAVHPRRDEALGILREAHATSAPALVLEEQLTALAIVHGPAAIPAVERLLEPAVAALGAGEQRALEVARWLHRASRRLHDALLGSERLRLLLAVSAILLRRPQLARDSGASADQLTPGQFAAASSLLPPSLLSRTAAIGVAFDGAQVEFLEVADAPHQIDVPDTTPRLVGLTWGSDSGARQLVVEPSRGRLVPLGAVHAAVTLTTLAGDAYEIALDRARSASGWSPEHPASTPSAFEDRVVEVTTLGEQGTPATGVFLTPTILATAGRFEGIPFLAVRRGDWSAQVRVFPPAIEESTLGDADLERVAETSGADVTFAELMGTEPQVAPVPLQSELLATRVKTSQADSIIAFTDAPVVVMLGGVPVTVPGETRVIYDSPDRFEVTLKERLVPDEFLGAPVIAPKGVAGIVTAIRTGPFPSTALQVVGAVVLERSRPRTGPVFLSYSRGGAGAEAAKRLAEYLERREIPVWVDFLRASPGEEWGLASARAIDDARVCVVLIDREWTTSEWSEREVDLMFRVDQQRRPVLPVLLDPVPLPERLGRLNALRAHPGDGEKWFEEVLRVVRGRGYWPQVGPDPIRHTSTQPPPSAAATPSLGGPDVKAPRPSLTTIWNRRQDPRKIVDRLTDSSNRPRSGAESEQRRPGDSEVE
jgi:hypothetical protein